MSGCSITSNQSLKPESTFIEKKIHFGTAQLENFKTVCMVFLNWIFFWISAHIAELKTQMLCGLPA